MDSLQERLWQDQGRASLITPVPCASPVLGGSAQLLTHRGTHTPTTRGAWVAVGWRVEVHFGAGGQATDEAGAVASGSLGCACCYPLTKRNPCGGPGHPCLLTQLCPSQHKPAVREGRGEEPGSGPGFWIGGPGRTA